MNAPEIQIVVTAEKMPFKMLLRDYFAAAALQGRLSNPKLIKAVVQKNPKPIGETAAFHAARAYAYADAMLAEREKGQP